MLHQFSDCCAEGKKQWSVGSERAREIGSRKSAPTGSALCSVMSAQEEIHQGKWVSFGAFLSALTKACACATRHRNYFLSSIQIIERVKNVIKLKSVNPFKSAVLSIQLQDLQSDNSLNGNLRDSRLAEIEKVSLKII